jgi:hypothetical protein
MEHILYYVDYFDLVIGLIEPLDLCFSGMHTSIRP